MEKQTFSCEVGIQFLNVMKEMKIIQYASPEIFRS